MQGLGEMMPEQLWSTTMNPSTRTLRRLTIHDAVEASRIFTLLGRMLLLQATSVSVMDLVQVTAH